MQRHVIYNQKKNQLIEADSEMKVIIKSVAIIVIINLQNMLKDPKKNININMYISYIICN